MSEITVTTQEPSFLKQLVAFEDGQVDMDLKEAWDQVLAAVQEHGKAGSLSLSVTITPDKEDDRVLAVKAEVKAKPPTRPAEPEVWVADGRGGAVRSQMLPGLGKADEHGGTGAFAGLGASLGEGESLTISSPGQESVTLTAEDAKRLRSVG